MFKFNFELTSEEISKDFLLRSQEKNDIYIDPEFRPVNQEYGVLNYEEFKKTNLTSKKILFKSISIKIKDGNFDLKETLDYVDSYKLNIDQNNFIAEINKTHDLIPGKYEGGLKVWELSVDLARFVFNINHINLNEYKLLFEKQTFSDLESIQMFFKMIYGRGQIKIIELGCGHALPTLSVYKYLDEMLYNKYLESGSCGVSNIDIIIYLQDFNKEILHEITSENLDRLKQTLNKKWMDSLIKTSPLKLVTKFIYGDWKNLYKENLLPKNFFNLILTSETIYNSANYKDLLNLFENCLVKESNRGLVLLSSKNYYFGCGGNLHEFLNLTRNFYKFNVSNNLLFNEIVNPKESKLTELMQSNLPCNLKCLYPAIGKDIVKISK